MKVTQDIQENDLQLPGSSLGQLHTSCFAIGQLLSILLTSLQENEHFLDKFKAQSQAHPGLKLDLNPNLHQMTQEFSPH